jgi:phage baseplate assembly protein gpV
MQEEGGKVTDIPSKDPANEASMGGMLRSVFQKFMQGTDNMLPATVLSYDRASNTATVRPIIAVLTTGGTTVPRAQVAKVPVLALGGGGFAINFPLQPGDMGWIEASDRDISLFMQSMTEDERPNTARLHSFEDGRFIPDVFRSLDVSDVADDAMTIQSLDGTVRVEISPTRVLMVAPDVQIDTDQLTVNGPSTFNGNVETFGTLENNGVDVGSTHTHGGVQTGGGNTGVPNP